MSKLANCELARAGHIVTLDLCYPRNEGNATTIELGLVDVRAADSIRITYDFDRDGWTIRQAAGRRFDVAADSLVWQEVAFVQAWALSEPGEP